MTSTHQPDPAEIAQLVETDELIRYVVEELGGQITAIRDFRKSPERRQTMAYISHVDRIRGHQLMPQSLEDSIPRLYSTDGQGSQVIVRAKFFTPSSSWTWYVTEYDPDSHICFGWVINSAMPECAELGEFSLDELDQVRGPFGLPVERDLYFKPLPLAVVMASHRSVA